MKIYGWVIRNYYNQIRNSNMERNSLVRGQDQFHKILEFTLNKCKPILQIGNKNKAVTFL